MENDNKNNSKLSFEQFNRKTKKDLYEIYLTYCDNIDYKRVLIKNAIQENNRLLTNINIQNTTITKQNDELKICRIIIWVLLIIIFLLSITLVVF